MTTTVSTLIPLYRSAILKWLKSTGAKSPAEIEDFIRRRFQAKWKARDTTINDNGIPQWRNDVHHARRCLTQHGLTVKGAGLVQAVPENDVKPRISTKKPAYLKEPKQDAKKVFDALTADILAALRNGTPPWRKLWGDLRRPKKHIDYAPLAIPTNAENGRPYFGLNAITLWNATRNLRLAESRWGTEQTWWRLGAEVTPKAPCTRVRYFIKVEGEYEEEARPIWHRLYNLAQVNGCDHLRRNQQPAYTVRTEGDIDIGPAWEFIDKCGAKVTWGGSEASYCPIKDVIKMPHKQRFRTELDVITVLFHELAHFTGHKRRLKRTGVVRSCDRNSPEYAFEELVAELTACFLLAYLDIPDRYAACHHAGYIKGYISLLEDDRRALQRAAGQASRATRFLLKLFHGNS